MRVTKQLTWGNENINEGSEKLTWGNEMINME